MRESTKAATHEPVAIVERPRTRRACDLGKTPASPCTPSVMAGGALESAAQGRDALWIRAPVPPSRGSPVLPAIEPPADDSDFDAYLAHCRRLTMGEIERLLPKGGGPMEDALYKPMRDYPLRHGKGFRPALCLATCRALGGDFAQVLTSAAVLELYHNAFLIHDDVEDESELRRGDPTLHAVYGTPVAVNVGDAMLAHTIEPLLSNAGTLGLAKALRILRVVAEMARESAEGQALELHWIRTGEWSLGDDDYVELVTKKTCWYTFIAPVRIGAIAAGAPTDRVETLASAACAMGIAFQIQDDVLNLDVSASAYGKEANGDLFEGKRTLILLHALRTCDSATRLAMMAALAKPRRDKSLADVRLVLRGIEQAGSLSYAQGVATQFARRATDILKQTDAWLQPSVHRRFLEALCVDVVERNR